MAALEKLVHEFVGVPGELLSIEPTVAFIYPADFEQAAKIVPLKDWR